MRVEFARFVDPVDNWVLVYYCDYETACVNGQVEARHPPIRTGVLYMSAEENLRRGVVDGRYTAVQVDQLIQAAK